MPTPCLSPWPLLWWQIWGPLLSRVPREASSTVVDTLVALATRSFQHSGGHVSGSGHSQPFSSLPDWLILGCYWQVLLGRVSFELHVMCCSISGPLVGDGIPPWTPTLSESPSPCPISRGCVCHAPPVEAELTGTELWLESPVPPGLFSWFLWRALMWTTNSG